MGGEIEGAGREMGRDESRERKRERRKWEGRGRERKMGGKRERKNQNSPSCKALNFINRSCFVCSTIRQNNCFISISIFTNWVEISQLPCKYFPGHFPCSVIVMVPLDLR